MDGRAAQRPAAAPSSGSCQAPVAPLGDEQAARRDRPRPGSPAMGRFGQPMTASTTSPSSMSARATAYCSLRRKPFVPSTGSSVHQRRPGRPDRRSRRGASRQRSVPASGRCSGTRARTPSAAAHRTHRSGPASSSPMSPSPGRRLGQGQAHEGLAPRSATVTGERRPWRRRMHGVEVPRTARRQPTGRLRHGVDREAPLQLQPRRRTRRPSLLWRQPPAARRPARHGHLRLVARGLQLLADDLDRGPSRRSTARTQPRSGR